METANLIFRMTHPAPSDLDAATALARAIVDQVLAAAPADTWRAEENADPVTVDHLKELVIPNETSVEGDVMGYGWGIVSGQPPRDLYLQMSIGVRGTSSSGKARLRFEAREQFGRLEEVYGRMARDSSVDRLQLSAGVSFLLDQSPDFRLPTLGWRNRLRKPPTGFRSLSFPDWVTVRDDSSHIELTLGPSAFDLDARDAAKVRDMVVESGLL